jgi:hypothetical protein
MALRNKRSGERREIRPDVTLNGKVGSIKEIIRTSIIKMETLTTIPPLT